MATQIQLLNFADTTGGLNLRADPFQLAPNESPDLLNVDVDPRGGVRLRKGIKTFADTLSGDAHSIGALGTTAGVNQVVVGVGTDLLYTTGTTFTTTGITRTVTTPNRMVSYKNKLYLQNGTDVAYSWDGTTAAAMGSTYIDTFTTSTDGNMPIAKLVATFQNHVFIANTADSPNRVHFSHPNFPERWRSTDYFDVDTGQDGDEITALVPAGDKLLIFKRRSIHALYGYDYTSWQLVPITHDIGTVRQESVIGTDHGVFFFSWPNGVMRIQGNKVDWVFESLWPLIDGRDIEDGYKDHITLGWGNRRLWMSTTYKGSTTPTRCWVMDPSLGKSGSWVAYDTTVGPFLEWKPTSGSTKLLAAGIGNMRVMELEVNSQAYDDYGSGQVGIKSYYRTPWISLKQPAVKKRWKRPLLVMRSKDAAIVSVQAYRDYDIRHSIRNYTITVQGSPAGYKWGITPDYFWGSGLWTSKAALSNELIKGSSMGSAKAISLKFNGPSNKVDWGMDEVTFKYIPKAVH